MDVTKSFSEWMALWILTVVVIACVVGGLALDHQAAKHDLSMFYQEGITEKKADPSKGTETIVTRGLLSKDQIDAILSLQKQRSDRLHDSAKLLYDFSKLALGALIAVVTQLFASYRRRSET